MSASVCSGEGEWGGSFTTTTSTMAHTGDHKTALLSAARESHSNFSLRLPAVVCAASAGSTWYRRRLRPCRLYWTVSVAAWSSVLAGTDGRQARTGTGSSTDICIQTVNNLHCIASDMSCPPVFSRVSPGFVVGTKRTDVQSAFVRPSTHKKLCCVLLSIPSPLPMFDYFCNTGKSCQ